MTSPATRPERAERLRAERDAAAERLAELEVIRGRFRTEHLLVSVYNEGIPQKYEQMFFDVADNALGINQAVKVRFDARKVVNRTIDEVSKHALLKDRVDMEQDRIGGTNPNLLGAKHVTDIVRAVTVGVTGRIGARREAQLDDAELVETANSFLDTLVAGFEDLEKVADGAKTPQQLRAESVLGSITMLRVLAGVYHELRVVHDRDDDEITDFWTRLAPHTKAPVADKSLLTTTGDFNAGAFGPLARSQNLKHLTETLSKWGTSELPEI